MTVMNRFAPVAESWKQTRPRVISKWCFLTKGISCVQVSLLNTSYFLPPLANRKESRSAVSVPPPVLPALVLPSFLPCRSLKLPLSFGSMHSRCPQWVVPQNHSLPRVTTLLWTGCNISSTPISNGNSCSVSDTENHCQLLSGTTFPLLGDQYTSPQMWGRWTNQLMHLTTLAGSLSPVFHHGVGVS